MKKSNANTVLQLCGWMSVVYLAVGAGFYAQADDAGRLASMDADGWHSWSVDAVDNAPSWCCYTFENKVAKNATCNLDGEINSYGSFIDRPNAVAEEVKIFAKVNQGQVEEVRAFDSTCPVNTKGRVVNHGKVSASESLELLRPLLGAKRHLANQAVAAVAIHNANTAQRILEETAGESKPVKLRKNAIFWMGQVRAQQSERLLSQLLLSDNNDEIREHAIFSVSQSNLSSRLTLIDRAGRSDQSKKVRGQAWFWMAQTGHAEAEGRIFAGMAQESSPEVINQAVFALSQLKGDVGTDALISVVESSDFSRRARKQALFWLAQSDSDRATNYLANVLDR